MSKNITRINPESLPNASEMGYSQISIVEPGRMAYISGQVAWQPNGEPAPSTLVDQMTLVSKNALASLEAVNATPDDVVMVRLYVVDLTSEKLEELMPVFLSMFNGCEPSVTGIGVQALAAPDLLVEMELVVRVPD